MKKWCKILLRILVSLILAVFFYSIARAEEEPFDIPTIAYYIQVLSPRLPDTQVQELANAYYLMSLLNDIDPKIIVAIAFQENSFRLSGISSNDIGHMQINYYWQIVRKKRINEITIEDLNDDWHLNIQLAIEHLKDCKQRHPESSSFPWWSCYNSPKPKHQKIYSHYVKRHLKKLNGEIK